MESLLCGDPRTMESLVFGDPITEETLKSKPEYANKKLTSADMAQIALNMKNAGGKNIAALNHAKALTDKLGIKNEVGLRSNVLSNRSANNNIGMARSANNNIGMASFGCDVAPGMARSANNNTGMSSFGCNMAPGMASFGCDVAPGMARSANNNTGMSSFGCNMTPGMAPFGRDNNREVRPFGHDMGKFGGNNGTIGHYNNRGAGAFRFNNKNKDQEEIKFTGRGVITVGVIYNATGNTLTYVTSHDYDGTRGPFPYPKALKNGQWGVFVHKNTPGSITGSRAAIVFRGQKENKKGCACSLVQRDWVMAWDNPGDIQWFGSADKKAYTEVREPGSYDYQWDRISNKLKLSGAMCSGEFDDCWSNVSIGEGNDRPKFEGIMRIDG